MLAFLAQILTLRAHSDEILTLRGFFHKKFSTLAEILTLRAHVDEILTLRGLFPPKMSRNAHEKNYPVTPTKTFVP